MEVKNLNKKLDKISKKGKAVGVNLALFDSKGIIYNYNYGFANKEQGIKSNNDSLYMIGSNTKLYKSVFAVCRYGFERSAEKSNRKERGLYVAKGEVFNADAVGTYNIMRKYFAISGIEKEMSVSGLANTRILKVAV